jgi:hypothetical protein
MRTSELRKARALEVRIPQGLSYTEASKEELHE